MNTANIKEIEYLKSKLSEITYDANRFNILIGDSGKFIFGIMTPNKSKETPLSKFMKFRTLYDTLKDLDFKIKISFEKGIEYAYSESVSNNFSFVNYPTEDEILAYYFIENALFRTSSLWDILAQLYCLTYDVPININEIHYKQIFNPRLSYSKKFKKDARIISDYLRESDFTNTDKEWTGNHKYANKCRNKMTHRNSPNVLALSDYDLNIKQHPTYMLKRIIEDYNTVSKYIDKILTEIEKTSIENFKKLKPVTK
ncbi:Cthe_2314 family HEPN domain-containing protein (plasmid) [Clostridium perfringens]|uniref:Cthe_2314 family HEPN domain-containing protein n=1 Tax=Clostridium perfringens TaxID=1502 RepID=UPI000B369D7C|nr:Cthe_2314 family HEPN domain-containing protein [Clostridium perfringens]EGT0690320.1 hypothetical protein [Clostridium perfringens]EGT0693481.1 hypothetical protein [Clostridium perfringens]EGT0696446.1 hypothetical protein [Clostridium perfringens]MDU3376275.1 Cthe_2314 family HEPN domain-containing protein [Clostridium perfringens]MDU3534232.1 Cthe_2314 family HEPN domain-containing protein [Clostridium perfringens]